MKPDFFDSVDKSVAADMTDALLKTLAILNILAAIAGFATL